MVIIIFAQDVEPAAAAAARDALQKAYGDSLVIVVEPEAEAATWPAEPQWDDLLIALFAESGFTESAQQFLERERSMGFRKRPCLPVACSGIIVPPHPLQDLKAMSFDVGRLSRRVGAILGMSLRNRDQLIFISYRAADGTALAEQVQDFLASEGYETWRDEAKDIHDGEGKILPGELVQEVIEQRLSKADLVLLLDTPKSIESEWIKLEVDNANAVLIPVLPVFFHDGTETRRISRFRALATLNRGYAIPATDAPISRSDLEGILEAVEKFLSEIYKRKLRVPFRVEKEFTLRGYNWNVRDQFIYEALKTHNVTLRTRVYSHCSHFEGIFDPSLIAFAKHLKGSEPRPNYALYVYDGMLLPQHEIAEILTGVRIEDNTSVIILHTQEVAALLHSNFTSLT